MSVEDLLQSIHSLPLDVRLAVRNQGGGHANHSLFWRIMGPDAGGQPTGVTADAIASSFGGFDASRISSPEPRSDCSAAAGCG